MNNFSNRTAIKSAYLIVLAIVFMLIGAAITFSIMSLNSSTETEQVDPNKPLYWVAPMDANYRRDRPGKSPMGMDLVAVYADDNRSNSKAGSDAENSITISPEVVNNLGVRTAEVILGQLNKTISTVGYVTYDEDQLVHIHPRVEGWVEKLYIKAAGDPVKKGAPLYEIYSPALVNAQEELLIALGRKNDGLIRAAEERLRALQLPKIAIEQLKTTRKIKQNITFFAPQEGVVDNLNIREGFYVKPGTTLMSIARLEQIWVEAEIFERQATMVETGLAVTMTLAYLPAKKWQGMVDYVYPTLNAKNRTLKVRLRFDNKDGLLKPNMFAQVLIQQKQEAVTSTNTLLVPKEAIIRSGQSDRVVLALGDGRFKSIHVQVGQYDQTSAEILSGLSQGDRVVTSAQFLLDSESSKSSDFKRMNYDDADLMSGHDMSGHDMVEHDMTGHDMSGHDMSKSESEQAKTTSARSAKVDGVINSIMSGHRMLNITRGPIKKWGRQAATLDFILSENIPLTDLAQAGIVSGSEISFSFMIMDDAFVITDIALRNEQQASQGARND